MSILRGSFIVKNHFKYFFIWNEEWKQLGTEKYDLQTRDIYNYPFQSQSLENFISTLEKYKLVPESIHNQTFETNKGKQKELVLFPVQKKPRSKTVVPLLYEQFMAIENKLSTVILYPWKVEGIKLNFLDTISFLQQIPLNNEEYIGSDLRFWSHVYRWSLDLICRQKISPHH